jgi:hypothetical protein
VLDPLDVAMDMMVCLSSHYPECEPHMKMLSRCYQHNLGPRSWTAGNHIC